MVLSLRLAAWTNLHGGLTIELQIVLMIILIDGLVGLREMKLVLFLTC